MIVEKKGGMTEFIPSPKEKREGLIRDHVIDLLINLDFRISMLEASLSMTSNKADEFAQIIKRIKTEEMQNQHINQKLLDSKQSKQAGKA